MMAQNAIEWFAKKNGVQANPDKFHFMLLSPMPSKQQALQLCDGTHLMSETEVTVLGVTIDDRLCFFAAKQPDNWMPWHVFLSI